MSVAWRLWIKPCVSHLSLCPHVSLCPSFYGKIPDAVTSVNCTEILSIHVYLCMCLYVREQNITPICKNACACMHAYIHSCTHTHTDIHDTTSCGLQGVQLGPKF